jgi:transcriptional regulator with XRE-family HTH domain
MTAKGTQANWGSDFVPEWTLGDRLRKARVHAGLDQAVLATDIGISRNTVRNYEAEHVKPRRPVLLAWAMRTGVSLAWLMGEVPGRPDGDAGWAPTGSNRQPAD